MLTDDLGEKTVLILQAVAAVKTDASARGFGKYHGGRATIACPACTHGVITYSVAGYNGHTWGRCSTDGCVRWME
jgi:hypothetical protein